MSFLPYRYIHTSQSAAASAAAAVYQCGTSWLVTREAGLNNYDQAYAACMQGRGYQVR